MPFDFPPDTNARLIARLARAGVLNDPATCSQWLRSRVDRAQRLQLMDDLFPISVAAVAA